MDLNEFPGYVDTFSLNRNDQKNTDGPGSKNERQFNDRRAIVSSHGISLSDAGGHDGERRSTGDSYSCFEFDYETGQHVDNSPAILAHMISIYENGELSDVTLVVGDREYRSHRLMLCLASDVFSCMLTSTAWAESNQSRVILKEEPQCIPVFDSFLRYLYIGSIHLNHYTVLPTLMLADKYNIIHLQRVCIDYMCGHLVTLIRHNQTISWLRYALIAGHHRLSTVCSQFARSNFHKVSSTRDFLTADTQTLTELVRQTELVVPDEYTLFRCVSRWLLYNKPHQFLSMFPLRSTSLHSFSNSVNTSHSLHRGSSGSMHSLISDSADPASTSQSRYRRDDGLGSRAATSECTHVVDRMSRGDFNRTDDRYEDSLNSKRLNSLSMQNDESLRSYSFDSDSTNSSYNHLNMTPEPITEAVLQQKEDMEDEGDEDDYSTNVATAILKLIRYSMMPRSHLNLVLQDPCVTHLSRDILQTFIPTSHGPDRKKSAGSVCTGDAVRCTPRNYTCEPWSVTISIENFSSLTVQEVKTLVFESPVDIGCQCRVRSPASTKKSDHPSSTKGSCTKCGRTSSTWDWLAVLHPKGVHFHKSIMVGLWRNLEVSGAVFDSVRLVLSATPGVPAAGGRQEGLERRLVDVSVLVTGVQDGVEYVKRVVERRCLFDESKRTCHIDHIVPFDELNRCDSEYLSGPDANTFKISLIIKPAYN